MKLNDAFIGVILIMLLIVSTGGLMSIAGRVDNAFLNTLGVLAVSAGLIGIVLIRMT